MTARLVVFTADSTHTHTLHCAPAMLRSYAPIVLLLTLLTSVVWYFVMKWRGQPFKGPRFDLDAFEADVLDLHGAGAQVEEGIARIKAVA